MAILLWLVVFAVLGFLVYLYSLDGNFQIKRSITIKASAQQIFDKLRDFKTWKDWSPWLLHEPDTALSFSENHDQVNGHYTWDGKIVGAGKLTHVSFEPPHSIKQRIEFTRPFPAQNDVSWKIEEHGDSSTVTWGMQGKLPFLFRFMAPRMSRIVGKDYELGLAMLKGQLEPDADYPRIRFDGPVERPQQTCIGKQFTGSFDDMKATMAAGFPDIMKTVEREQLVLAGPPLTIYHRVDEKNRKAIYTIAVPIDNGDAPKDYTSTILPAGKYFKVTVQGGYDFLELAWTSTMNHLRMKKIKFDAKRPSCEVYENNPSTVASKDIVTTLYLPVR